MKFRTLTYAVIGTLLFFAFRPTAVDAVQTQTTTVPASRGKTEQTGTFQAGPGIAISTRLCARWYLQLSRHSLCRSDRTF